jgi:putative DNA primase/helicase
MTTTTAIQDLPGDLTPVDVVAALIELHGSDLRYSSSHNKWLVFDEITGWVWDRQNSCLQSLVIETLSHLCAMQPPEGSTPYETRNFLKWRRRTCRRLMNNSGINGVIALASRGVELQVADTSIDAATDSIGTPKGVLNLRTGKVRRFDRGEIVTKRLPVSYEPTAKCRRWQRFLVEVLGSDAGVQAYFQELMGYALTGDTSEQKMWLLVGKGSNGKSTLLHAIKSSLGYDYAQQSPEAVLLGRQVSGGASSELVRLQGARCAILTETNYGQSINEERVKALVAGDAIAARALYENFIEFIPQAKYFLATNHLPTVRGSDKGIWRRLVVVPFDREFEVGADKTLTFELLSEMEGIIAWAVQGAKRWYKRGGLPTLPSEWDLATGVYRSEQDVLSAFLDECAEFASGDFIGAAELYVAYEEWSKQSGRPVMQQQEFGHRMNLVDTVQRCRRGKANRFHYAGLRLR